MQSQKYIEGFILSDINIVSTELIYKDTEESFKDVLSKFLDDKPVELRIGFLLSDISQKHRIKFFKMSEVFAQIGGISSILTFVASIISVIVYQKFLNKLAQKINNRDET